MVGICRQVMMTVMMVVMMMVMMMVLDEDDNYLESTTAQSITWPRML